ncbi:hypothetical protein [Marinomonas sp. 2405UD68-3]|uniref:hypothetical protein n=1 Tax=Marinomonas sp. 2405UD68-3 TaxID=3391835 RepID=UPI0039C9DA2A
MNKLKLLPFVALSVFVSACTPFKERVDDQIAYAENLTQKMQRDSSSAQTYKQGEVSDNIWLGPFNWGDENSMKPSELSISLSYNSTSPTDLETTLEKLARDSRVKISLSKDAQIFLGLIEEESSVEGNQRSTDKEAKTSEKGEILYPTEESYKNKFMETIISGDQTKSTEELPKYLLNGTKNLQTWLDSIAVHYSLFWDHTYIGSEPFITLTASVEETMQFEGLMALSDRDSKNESENQSWKELKDFAEDSKSKFGTVHISELTGRIYVNDRPDIVERVRNRVNYENSIFAKQIHYKVQIVTVDLEETENYSGGITAFYDDLKNSFNLSPGVSAGSGVAVGVSNVNPSSNLNNSSAKAYLNNLISKNANAKEYSFITRNKTQTIQTFQDNISYVKTVETTNSEFNAGTTPTIDEINEGVVLNFNTSILSNNRIALNLDFNQEYLKNLIYKEYDGNEISLPTVNNTKILNQFIVKSGQSFILTDSSIDNGSSMSGPAKALGWFQLLLGARSEIRETSSLRILVITPTIIDGGM